MADSDNKDKQEDQKEAKTEEKESKSFIGRLLPWVIMIIVVGLCAGAGLGLGSILAGTDQQKGESAIQSDETDKTKEVEEDSEQTKNSGEVWYYELEPVVANLNEPSVARYVSASLTLQISSSVDEKEYKSLIDDKKPPAAISMVL